MKTMFGKRVKVLMWCMFLLTLMAFGPALASAAKETPKAPAKASAKTHAKAAPAKSEAWETWSKPNAVFDAGKMGDMSGWDPAKWVNPEGDTIRIAVFWPHSGPAAANGELA